MLWNSLATCGTLCLWITLTMCLLTPGMGASDSLRITYTRDMLLSLRYADLSSTVDLPESIKLQPERYRRLRRSGRRGVGKTATLKEEESATSHQVTSE